MLKETKRYRLFEVLVSEDGIRHFKKFIESNPHLIEGFEQVYPELYDFKKLRKRQYNKYRKANGK